MPLDEMNLLHAQIYQDYMGYPLVYEWVDITIISKRRSTMSAMPPPPCPRWNSGRTRWKNRDKAMQIYDKLTQYTINVEYLETQESGAERPFSSDCVQRVAQALNDEMGRQAPQGRMTFIPPHS